MEQQALHIDLNAAGEFIFPQCIPSEEICFDKSTVVSNYTTTTTATTTTTPW
ncbi:MAG: hypothetical protein ACOCTU_04525 [Bacteroidota bacterium]